MSTIQMWVVRDELGPVDLEVSLQTPSVFNLGSDFSHQLHQGSFIFSQSTGTADEIDGGSGNVLDTVISDLPLSVVAVSDSDSGADASTVCGNGGLITVAADGSYTFDSNSDFDLNGEETDTTSVYYHVSDGVKAIRNSLLITVSAHQLTVDDVYWDYVQFILHPEGETGSQVFTDHSDEQLSLNVYDGAQVSNTLSAPSLLLDGSGDYVALTDYSYFYFTSDGTIDIFFKASGAKTSYVLFSKLYSSRGYMLYVNSNFLRFLYYDASGGVHYVEGNINIGTAERHVAVVRSSGVVKVYVDGVLDITITISPEIGTYSVTFLVGKCHQYSTLDFAGHIMDVRVTPSIVRYTANFTPPSYPLPIPA